MWDVELLEWVQRMATKMLRGLEHLCHEGKVEGSRAHSVWRRLLRDYTAAFQYLKGAYKKSVSLLFSDRTKSNLFKLKRGDLIWY